VPWTENKRSKTKVAKRNFLPVARGRAEALPPLSPDHELDPADINFELGVLACVIAASVGATHPLIDAVGGAWRDVAARDQVISPPAKRNELDVAPAAAAKFNQT
jgi:hypothetical protein